MNLTKIDIIGLVVVGLLLVWQDARSADMVMHFGSKHIDNGASDYNFNEKNLGIGVRYPTGTNFSIRGGIYDNSYNSNSVYFGGDWYTASNVLNLGVQAGLVTGYAGTPQGGGTVTPYILPYVSIRTGVLTTEIGCIPPVIGKIGVLTLSARVELF